MLTNKEQRQLEKGFNISKAQNIQDYKDCETVQIHAWGMHVERELVPLHILRPLAEKGGIVMNAYDKAGRPVGTNISFLGMHHDKLILYSHMTGVVPEYQSRGVGLALKLKQREFAIERGFDLVCWTYDPMQSVNNWFNLNKLGAVSRTYYVNYYGDMPDKLNQGLESDRFMAEWWVLSPRVKSRAEQTELQKPSGTEGLHVVNETVLKEGIHQPSGKTDLSAADDAILVEVPYNYAEVRKVDPSILQAWRLETRRLYMNYFSSAYVATGSVLDTSNQPRSFVKLERRPLERILQT